MTKICLAMNVRDAEASIERCIRSARPLVSEAVIIDTGSLDDTMKIVYNATRHAELPTTLLVEDWFGHAHNRSLLLERVRDTTDADYALMLDADMELVVDGELPELTADEIYIPIHDRALIYPLPLLTSTRKRFYYAGVAHSYLACHDGPTTEATLDNVRLIDHGGGGGRPGKLERDRDVLALQVARDPTDSRSWFYLAQSFRDLDEVGPAIAAYKKRAEMGGWDEEVYISLYQAGVLLCEHVDAREGMKMLVDAYTFRPHRAEALRALANVADSVADKIPFPTGDRLFVVPSKYKTSAPPAAPVAPADPPPFPSIRPKAKRGGLTAPKSFDDITAIIPTRGNVDLGVCLQELPYPEIIIWDNGEAPETRTYEHDARVRVFGGTNYRAFGRYAAIPHARKPFIYWQDDDIIFYKHAELLEAYEPKTLVTNMDEDWINGAGYRDLVYMQGAGSLIDSRIPDKIWSRYLARYPWDDDALVEADFVFGVLVPGKVVDLGYAVRSFADDPDRLYTQPGQTERKWKIINRCREMLAAPTSA